MRKLLILLLLLTLPGLAVEALGLKFEAGIPLSPPAETGLDAVSFYAPPEADAAGARLEVLVHTLPAAVAEEMRAAGMDPFANEKTTYLGLADSGSGTVKRTLFGKESLGEVHPEALGGYAVECHWTELADGRFLLLAFRRPSATPQAELDALADSVCKTMTQ